MIAVSWGKEVNRGKALDGFCGGGLARCWTYILRVSRVWYTGACPAVLHTEYRCGRGSDVGVLTEADEAVHA